MLEFPLLGLSAAHCSALATQCPALRAANLQSISQTTVEFDPSAGLVGLDDDRAGRLAALPALDWLVAEPVNGLTAAGLRALLDRPSRRPWWALSLKSGWDGEALGEEAAGAIGHATGALPGAFEMAVALPVAGAAALRGLPTPVVATLKSLTVINDEPAVWGALSGLPLTALSVSIGTVTALDGLADAVFPCLSTLVLSLSVAAKAAMIDFKAVAAAAPALADLTLADAFWASGFGADRIDEALAALPRLTALAFTPVAPDWDGVADGSHGRVGAANARRVSTSRTAVRAIIQGEAVDPWWVPAVEGAGGGKAEGGGAGEMG